jgi:hypothetical protein
VPCYLPIQINLQQLTLVPVVNVTGLVPACNTTFVIKGFFGLSPILQLIIYTTPPTIFQPFVRRPSLLQSMSKCPSSFWQPTISLYDLCFGVQSVSDSKLRTFRKFLFFLMLIWQYWSLFQQVVCIKSYYDRTQVGKFCVVIENFVEVSSVPGMFHIGQLWPVLVVINKWRYLKRWKKCLCICFYKISFTSRYAWICDSPCSVNDSDSEVRCVCLKCIIAIFVV